jgi:ribosome-associated heat shock protein Hsp15
MDDKASQVIKVRLDKWLWAARFFKTRSLAKQAIEGGKVHCNGKRCKSSKDIQINDCLLVRQGWDEKEVLVKELSDKRQGSVQASRLYEETLESIERRQAMAEQRKALRSSNPISQKRPSKKDRRQIHRFKQIFHE